MSKQKHWISARGCVYNIYYHMVWSTKYRKSVLNGEMVTYLKELHIKIAKDRGIQLKEQEVMPDHVHLFVSAHPKFSPSQMVKIFKGITGKFLFEKYPELKNEVWKGHLWNPSYYVGTMGDVTKEVIEQYIKMQKTRNGENEDNNKTN
ncbi:IS200/IS605 family transposase [Patescibacteria group bacterium]|nr:IS200/IS605 family transposase [Patescibacteria group bacterium]